jgi:glycosyltransferase involved in cell wall biosynthesis
VTSVLPNPSDSSTKRLRVAMVTAKFAPHVGGIETHVLEVSRRLVDRGMEVTVLTTEVEGASAATEVRDGFTVERYPTVGPIEDFYLSPTLARAISQGGYDVVHVQGVNTLLPFLALRAARKSDTPAVLTFHTGGHSSKLRTVIRAPQWSALSPALRKADRLIAVCEYERDTFARHTGLGQEAFSVIRNGAERLPIDEDVAPVMEGDPLVLSIGRLEKYKGHHRVIAAMPELLRAAPGARLGIIGQGPYEAELQRQVVAAGLESRVQFLSFGPSERGNLGALLARADVVTLMSEYEAHPVAVMEALALGTPAVVAEGSGLTELGRGGLVHTVPVQTAPAELATTMLDVARGNSMASMPPLPTWDDCTDGIAKVYEDVIR